MDRRVDVLPLWFDLNKRLPPLNLSQLAASGKCRIHGTTDHGEMDCLVFLLRVDLALRGKFSFSQIHEPAVFVNLEEDFLVFKEDINREPKNICGRRYWCHVHSLIYSESTCPSCQDTIDLVKFQLGWYEEISIGGGKHFFQLSSWTPKNEEDKIYQEDMVDSDVQDNRVDEPSHIISQGGEFDKKIEETIEFIQEREEMVGKDQQMKTHKEVQMEHRKVDEKEIFGDPSCIIQGVTLEDGLQEVSNILKEEDNQVGELNKELQDITREFKYEENIDKPIHYAISTTFFGGMLEDPMEEIQRESLPEALQGDQVVANGMIHHQLRPP